MYVLFLEQAKKHHLLGPIMCKQAFRCTLGTNKNCSCSNSFLQIYILSNPTFHLSSIPGPTSRFQKSLADCGAGSFPQTGMRPPSRSCNKEREKSDPILKRSIQNFRHLLACTSHPAATTRKVVSKSKHNIPSNKSFAHVKDNACFLHALCPMHN